jgi:6-methylsalicylate decarboxylase
MKPLVVSPSRRDVLSSLAGLAASSVFNSNRALAQSAPAGRQVIDVHHHIVPPKYVAAHKDDQIRGGAGQPYVLAWTPHVSLDQMDEAGVSTAILSLSTPGTWFGSVEDGRRTSRLVNEYAAGMVRDYPGRFGFFAAIPLPDTEGSLKEMEYAFETLKADGIGLMTSYDTVPLGDQRFAPVFEEMNRRKCTVFIHRTAATCCLNLRQLPGNQEFIVDDLRMLNSLLTSGALARYSDIRWIHAHGDKVLPWVAKLNGAPINGPARAGNPPWAPQGVQHELKKVYVDSAGNTKYTMDELRRLDMLTNRVMFGTDVPWGNLPASLASLRNRMGLSPAEIAAVEHETALTLFPRLKS